MKPHQSDFLFETQIIIEEKKKNKHQRKNKKITDKYQVGTMANNHQ